jgi:hypothetical protein
LLVKNVILKNEVRTGLETLLELLNVELLVTMVLFVEGEKGGRKG